MNRSWRALIRIVRCTAFLGAWTIRLRVCRPARTSPDYEAWRRRFFGGAARGLLRRLGVELDVEGEFPAGAGILAANHLGYLDVLVLAALGPSVFVSRADVADWPLLGPLTRWCGTIYIDRGRHEQIPLVVEQMGQALGTGARVVFFPEGTSGAGDRVMPFRGPLFEVAMRTAAQVHVAALSYRTEPGDPVARDSVCWWGDAGFFRHFFGLAGLRRVRARVRFSTAPVTGVDRKELARNCHARISEHFEPVTGSGGPA